MALALVHAARVGFFLEPPRLPTEEEDLDGFFLEPPRLPTEEEDLDGFFSEETLNLLHV